MPVDLSFMRVIFEVGAYPFLVWLLWYLTANRMPQMEKNFFNESKADRELFREELKKERELFASQMEEQRKNSGADLQGLSSKIDSLVRAIRRQSAILLYHDAMTTSHSTSSNGGSQSLIEMISGLDGEDDE